MQFALVGNRKGRRVILWPQALKMALFLTPFPALVTVGVYALATRQWSTPIFLLGLAVGAAVTLIVIALALCTPLHRLPMLPEEK
jgi:hypothetical protein